MSVPATTQNHFLAVYRVVIGLLFTCHGIANLFGVMGGADGHGATVPTGLWPYWYASLIHLVCGPLLIVGLGSRSAAVIGSGAMAYAYFTVHLPTGLWPIADGGEAATLFCWALLVISVFGPGAWALDALLPRRRGQAGQAAASAV
ncbi:DoxX family protein [Streptomyces diastatochromogenes]|uniref:DoxX family protein n=1 Tax=Streptomyces diastatochromogenes TaxID=42236 RepID=A0A233S079_STRDA|nr:DoxX family protein [Streptomyces diastatochromogenes]MCZ0990848.1 DoxX family protein [Streptomyces diastatochromogenes]OXY89027.1 DoxX family protein [Streptomyces diastatochromogenes]